MQSEDTSDEGGGGFTVRFDPRLPVMISRQWALDARLSHAARGLLLALVASLDGADRIGQDDLAARSPDDAATVTAALHELETLGYLIATREGSQGLADPWPRPPVAAPARTGPSFLNCVYYLRSSITGDIKIGYSGAVRTRVRKIAYQHGPVELLATEPGGWYEEHQRHGEFAHLRTSGEWFRPAADLLAHIASLQKAA